MNVYIDESGSFVSTDQSNSWNCVAAYLLPETDSRHAKKAIHGLKRRSNVSHDKELKLRDIKESDYLKFLQDIVELDGILFSVATDSSFNKINDISCHQKMQVEAILKNLPHMKYEGGRKGIQLLADELSSLSPQLYAQLHCQINLIDDLLRRGILYFVQRKPRSLGKFRWRVDQKNSEKPVFESTFKKMTPALLQSKTIDEPAIMLEGADYSSFSKYRHGEGEAPTYLKEEYGIEINPDSGINLEKLLREDLKFEDSKHNWGVQIVDLLASGIRRCLRGDFSNNRRAAELLGSLMVSNQRNQYPIKLIGFREGLVDRETPVHSVVNLMIRTARPMLHTNK